MCALPSVKVFVNNMINVSDEVPGPNHYHINLPHKPDAKKSPAHSMSKRIQVKSGKKYWF